MTNPKGSGRLIGNSNAAALPRNSAFSAIPDLADETRSEAIRSEP